MCVDCRLICPRINQQHRFRIVQWREILIAEINRLVSDLIGTHPAFSVKFGEETVAEEEMREGSREILLVSVTDTKLDLSQAIYDYVCLSLPMQRVHAEGECNPDTVRFLGHERPNEEAGETNSPFAALKGLFDGK